MSHILHLSDLHLGKGVDSTFGEYKSDIVPLEERRQRQLLLENTLRELACKQIPIESIIVSGDITTANAEEGYREFEQLLACLGDAKPDPSRIVIVPGNHDVAWELDPEDPTRRYEHFDRYIRSKGYITPMLEGLDIDEDGKPLSRVDLGMHVMISENKEWAIVPINSAHYCGRLEPIYPISAQQWNDIPGWLARSGFDIDEYRRTLRKLRLRDMARISLHQMSVIKVLASHISQQQVSPLLIGVIHHQLLPVTLDEELKPFESLSNLAHLRLALRDNNFSVVLHGHKHSSKCYVDHVYSDDVYSNSVHKILTLSSPAANTSPGNSVCRLLEVVDGKDAPRVLISDIPFVDSGTQLKLPKAKVFSLWQTDNRATKQIEGDSMDKVYKRALSMFSTAPAATTVPLLICKLDPSFDVALPRSYPHIDGVDDKDREEWFKQTVTWWQKHRFRRLFGSQFFNHGRRIYTFGGETNQLVNVVEALKKNYRTSRAVISLLNPTEDCVPTGSRFPSFCLVQFSITDGEGDTCFLDVAAYYRKQEMRYWWPVNVAELCRLRDEVWNPLRTSIASHRRTLHKGSITTIACIATVDDVVPKPLVPALEMDFEECPEKLWDMVYAVAWKQMPSRSDRVASWEQLLKHLSPPIQQDPSGVPVPVHGLKYLKELAEHFARHHDEPMTRLATAFERLLKRNSRHADLMSSDAVKQDQHDEWRKEVMDILNEIGAVIGTAFESKIDQLD